ncbi:MAG: hypothetical protein JRI87_05775, partial [Deltaproteobacteria bacterium]|nr:hypothetical protein [Deltaproteobacteria bacterium]
MLFKDSTSSLLTHSKWIIVLLLFILSFLVYLPTLEYDFVWDDDVYVVRNVRIHSLNAKSLAWMATGFDAGNWHPLTWFSHALDYAFWDLDSGKHHLLNLILHGLNTALVFILIMTLLSRIASPARDASWNLIAGGVTSLLF